MVDFDLESLEIIGEELAMDELHVPIDLVCYHPMIVKLAAQFWRSLPIEAKHWLDIDDLIQDGSIAAMKACRSWTSSRGRPSTLIYTAVGNSFRNRLDRMRATKRQALETVSLDNPDYELEAPIVAGFDQIALIRSGMELLLQMASSDARKFLADTLLAQSCQDIRTYDPGFLKLVITELRELMAECQLTYRDMALLMLEKENCYHG